MSERNKRTMDRSSFFRQILDNRFATALIYIILILVIILLLVRTAPFFGPLKEILDFIMLPVIAALILYYMFIPLIRFLSSKGFNENVSILLIFLILIILLVWGVIALVPALRDQYNSFMERLPEYTADFNQFIDNIPISLEEFTDQPQVQSLIDSIMNIDIGSIIDQQLNNLVSNLGGVIGTVVSVVTGIVVTPIILYYLVVDGHKVPSLIAYVIPEKNRSTIMSTLRKINHQLSMYIRGQISVALAVAIIFAIGYSIIGLDFAISLAVLGGLLNLIPYLGSFIAALLALIIAVFDSPQMVIKVGIVIMVEQFIEGRIISPLILGNNLDIHPVTILLILLVAGRFGGIGALLVAVPLYAVIKVIVSDIFAWYRKESRLYDDSDSVEEFRANLLEAEINRSEEE